MPQVFYYSLLEGSVGIRREGENLAAAKDARGLQGFFLIGGNHEAE